MFPGCSYDKFQSINFIHKNKEFFMLDEPPVFLKSAKKRKFLIINFPNANYFFTTIVY